MDPVLGIRCAGRPAKIISGVQSTNHREVSQRVGCLKLDRVSAGKKICDVGTKLL